MMLRLPNCFYPSSVIQATSWPWRCIETTDYYGNNLHMNLVHHGQSDSYAKFCERMCIIMALIGLIPRPCTSSVLITYSMQKWSKKVWGILPHDLQHG